MSWTETYWDLLDRLYWSPQYLGLKSIPQTEWTIEGDKVSIPKAMTNKSGPLYRRIRSGDEYWRYVHRQEEVFNYLFDLIFAVLPGDAIAQVLHPITKADPQSEYQMFGAKLRTRYGSSHNSNVTTPDGFFVAPKSIVGIELKFNAKTSRDQLAKYLMLFAAEENLTGEREHLDLIFIFNRDPNATFKKHVGFETSDCHALPLERLTEAIQNSFASRFFRDNQARARSTLARLNVHCITWSEFAGHLSTFAMTIDANGGMGDRTLKRLIDGLLTEINRHPLSNVVT
jgi:hypothetical protein